MLRIRYWFLFLTLFSSSSFATITHLRIGAPEDFACAHQAFFAELSRQHQYRVEVKILPFKDVVEALNANKIHVSAHGITSINVFAPGNEAVPSKPYKEDQVYWVSKKKKRLLDNINQLLEKVGNPYRYYQDNGTCEA